MKPPVMPRKQWLRSQRLPALPVLSLLDAGFRNKITGALVEAVTEVFRALVRSDWRASGGSQVKTYATNTGSLLNQSFVQRYLFFSILYLL